MFIQVEGQKMLVAVVKERLPFLTDMDENVVHELETKEIRGWGNRFEDCLKLIMDIEDFADTTTIEDIATASFEAGIAYAKKMKEE